MEKLFNKAVVVMFCAFIFYVPVMTKLGKHVEFSIFENRKLAAPPVFAVDSLFNGEYLPSWDVYFSDQIWNRDRFIEYYTYLNIDLLKKPVVNDVVVQKNILLPFNEYAADDPTLHEQITDMTNKLALLNDEIKEYGGKFIYVGVPEQYSMFRDLYPSYLNNNDKMLSQIEEGFFAGLENKNVSFINMRAEFLKTGDCKSFYSMTDHHYNLFGAFYTYQTLMNKIEQAYGTGLPVLNETEIEFIAINNPFYGSRNRKLYNVYNSDEKLYYYTQKTPLPFTREDNGEISSSRVFHLPADENSTVVYDVYMGGDVAETIIKTDRAHLPSALVFGDSFTNALETFLYQSFNETRSLDLRYYDEKTLAEYIAEYKPDYVFCLRDDTQYLSEDGNGQISVLR